VLKEKYCLDKQAATHLTSFLEPMLHVVPEKRATAELMLKHKWLEGVVVMGELEAAAVSERSKSGEGPSKTAGKKNPADGSTTAATTTTTTTTTTSGKIKLTGSAGAGPAKGTLLGKAPAAAAVSTPDSATRNVEGSHAARSVSGSKTRLKAGSPTTVLVG
jgi:serine/threonine-protein kinase SRPK3